MQGLSDPGVAEHAQRFFRTGPGEYGEGDTFIGIRVPVLRRVAKQRQGLSLPDTELLLRSPIHEERLLAVLLLVTRYEHGDASTREDVFTSTSIGKTCGS